VRFICALILFTFSLAQAQLATYGFTKTVTTSGVAVRLSSTTLKVRSFMVQSLSTNTGVIFVGGSDVLAASKNGAALPVSVAVAFLPIGEIKTVNYYDLMNVWIDSTVNAEGVSVTYTK
jgi:hypothetical protein